MRTRITIEIECDNEQQREEVFARLEAFMNDELKALCVCTDVSIGDDTDPAEG